MPARHCARARAHTRGALRLQACAPAPMERCTSPCAHGALHAHPHQGRSFRLVHFVCSASCAGLVIMI